MDEVSLGIRVREVAFQGIEDLEGLMKNGDLSVVQLRSGVPRGRFMYAQADGFDFLAAHYEADLRTRGVYTPRVGLAVRTSRRGQVTSRGRASLPGNVSLLPGGSEQDSVVVGQIAYAVLSLDVSTLVALGGGDAWEGDTGIWERPHEFRAPAHVRDRTCRSIEGFLRVLEGPEGEMSGRRLESFQKDLVECFLSRIALDQNEPERRRHHSAKLVRAVEDWVAAKAPEPVRISDVCGQFGLSRRSLERAFHETLDMGPVQYLMARRLSAARLMLAKADPQTVSVTDVAIDQGFWELGRFAVRYRQMFGERPSETLRRSCATPSPTGPA